MSNKKKDIPKNKTAPNKKPPALWIGLALAALAVVLAVIFWPRQEDPEEAKVIRAHIQIRDYGDITVELDPEAAPITVKNFVKLARDGYYDGLTFHRIIEGFMMQGGQGTEYVQPIKGEFAANGVDNPLSHTRGAISMARTSDPNSADTQFFIVHEDSTFLDGDYAAFGYVIEGMDVVDAICEAAQPIDGNGAIAEDAQPVIESIHIHSGEPH